MARREEDREDLLKEATALVERAEFRLAREPEPVVIGFRRDGSASIFFGAEPVYQFNALDQVRRAYHDGLLFKAERGVLVSLRRRRVPGEVQLLRENLTPDESHQFLQELSRRITALSAALNCGDFQLVGQVPESADVCRRVIDWLDRLALPPAVAAGPHVGR